MKKVLYTNFKGIDEVLAKMLSDKEFKKAITRSNLYKFWSKVVGEKFSSNSKPFSMAQNNTMIIACKNSSVAQELMLRKSKILKDFEPYTKALKLNIKDFRFDPKKWIEETE